MNLHLHMHLHLHLRMHLRMQVTSAVVGTSVSKMFPLVEGGVLILMLGLAVRLSSAGDSCSLTSLRDSSAGHARSLTERSRSSAGPRHSSASLPGDLRGDQRGLPHPCRHRSRPGPCLLMLICIFSRVGGFSRVCMVLLVCSLTFLLTGLLNIPFHVLAHVLAHVRASIASRG